METPHEPQDHLHLPPIPQKPFLDLNDRLPPPMALSKKNHDATTDSMVYTRDYETRLMPDEHAVPDPTSPSIVPAGPIATKPEVIVPSTQDIVLPEATEPQPTSGEDIPIADTSKKSATDPGENRNTGADEQTEPGDGEGVAVGGAGGEPPTVDRPGAGVAEMPEGAGDEGGESTKPGEEVTGPDPAEYHDVDPSGFVIEFPEASEGGIVIIGGTATGKSVPEQLGDVPRAETEHLSSYFRDNPKVGEVSERASEFTDEWQREMETEYQRVAEKYQQLADSGFPLPDEVHDQMRKWTDLVRSSRFIQRTMSYLPGPGESLESHPINDYIASGDTRSANTTMPQTSIEKNGLGSKVFSYLRDQHGAKTVGEAVNAVRQGSVPREVVELWIDEGAVGMDPLDKAMAHAYPDLAQKLAEAKRLESERYRRELREFTGRPLSDEQD